MAALLTELRRGPIERRRRITLAVVTLALAALVPTVRAMETSRRKLCAGGAERLVGVWDPARKAGLRQALLATHVPYAANAADTMERILDRYASDWVAAHDDACEATHVRHEQSAALLDLRSACLQERLDQLRSFVDVHAAIDTHAVERGVDAAQHLPPLSDCANLAALSAPVPLPAAQDRAPVAEVRKRLVRSEALGRAARYREALDEARGADGSATVIAYPPLEAESKLRLGIALSESDDFPGAVAALRASFLSAFRGRADTVAADAAIALVGHVGDRQGHYAEAHEWVDWAQAAIDRLPRHELKQASLEQLVGTLTMREGKYEEALAHTNKAVALQSALLRGDDLDLARALQALGTVHYMRAEYNKALYYYERSLAIRKSLYGPDHPLIAKVLVNEANVLGDQGQHDRAIAMYEQALAIFKKTVPDDNSAIATILNNVGDEYRLIGQPHRALASYRRALQIWEDKLGRHHAELGVAYHNMGDALRDLGQYREALDSYDKGVQLRLAAVGAQHPYLAGDLTAEGETYRLMGDGNRALQKFQEGLAVAEKALGESHPDVAQSLLGIGHVRMSAGDFKGARAPLERALTIWKTQPGDVVDDAEAHFLLAQVVWSLDEPIAALALARDAEQLYAGAPRRRDQAAVVATWLAARAATH